MNRNRHTPYTFLLEAIVLPPVTLLKFSVEIQTFHPVRAKTGKTGTNIQHTTDSQKIYSESIDIQIFFSIIEFALCLLKLNFEVHFTFI